MDQDQTGVIQPCNQQTYSEEKRKDAKGIYQHGTGMARGQRPHDAGGLKTEGPSEICLLQLNELIETSSTRQFIKNLTLTL